MAPCIFDELGILIYYFLCCHSHLKILMKGGHAASLILYKNNGEEIAVLLFPKFVTVTLCAPISIIVPKPASDNNVSSSSHE